MFIKSPCIDLTRHSKIWINPDGEIPKKIVERLKWQKETRPRDAITLFVNKACEDKSNSAVESLRACGVKIKIIELCLEKNEKQDDPFIIACFNKALALAKKEKNLVDRVRASVRATNVLRLMKLVQHEGLYSDNDVLFLKFEATRLLSPYLFGQYEGEVNDVHLFGVAINDPLTTDYFYTRLVEKMKKPWEEEITPDEFEPPCGLYLIPDEIISKIQFGHLKFAEIRDCIITGSDQSHHDITRAKKLLNLEEDSLLDEAKSIVASQEKQYRM
ncbi:TPA: hypothetical protein ACK8Z3_001741 [Legionella pneumophila]|uniref:Uncharacterized protein n=2 Tax=Legionella pneumophila TaxID=446 RepID=A0A3A6VBA3_LEGPN|nr:hypothetical protein [Legionella pneumophila]ERH43934.1 hypothetical protein N750_10565 [Legionella pneumophila str. Leg01/53]ERH44606.1 hypothetical protein N751_13410 [Legionella pneumophila str. Leg01/11]ERI48200.1 hypothetical protein N749_10745 [Legionella pneumophila str. Leg01/20]ANN94401.1 hypothetical protein A9P84_01200 [Legionella pneumophila]AOU50937.1 hypothetical protein A9E86_00925 [Legionella pneumophila]